MLSSGITESLLKEGGFWLFAQTTLIATIIAFVWKKVRPLWRLYSIGRKNDEIAGSKSEHWFYGHVKKYPSTHDGLLNASRERPCSNPLMFNHWVAPCISFLQCYHPDTASALVSSGAPKNQLTYNFIRPWIGDGLLTSKGKKWQRNRHLLTPAFHFNILKGYVSIFNKCCGEMLTKWESLCRHNPVEISCDVTLMTLDTMLQCAMSAKTNCQKTKDHPYISSVQEVASLIVFRINNPFYLIDFVFRNSEPGRRFQKAADVVHKYAEDIIAKRKKELEKEQSSVRKSNDDEQSDDCDVKKEKKMPDFLDILLTTKDEDGKGLSDSEIRDEVDTFLFEGHDTTASGIQWTLYNLAKYPDLQEKCREEVKQVVGDKENVEWEDLSKLSYLTMFIKEDLRLFPPVAIVSRRLEDPLSVRNTYGEETTIQPGSTVSLHIFGLHRNKHVWDQPEKFDPERFNKENSSKRSPHAYLPFSAGSRNCIGQNFAMNEMKIAVAQTLRRFRLALPLGLPEPEMLPRLILQCKDGIHINLEPIAS